VRPNGADRHAWQEVPIATEKRRERLRGKLFFRTFSARSLATFEFLAIPSLNKSLVLDLARCEFIERKENILALGNSGTGKTHIALALGLAACQKGFRVRFTTAASLAHELIEAKDERRLMRVQKMLSSFELLIIDELGFVPLSKTGAELLSRSSAAVTNAALR
jgi:DNA replication protein DnaC